jgi:hypothetical protein
MSICDKMQVIIFSDVVMRVSNQHNAERITA